MIEHIQRSTRNKVFYEPKIVNNGDGTLTCPAGRFWHREMAYALPVYQPNIGRGEFRLIVEKTTDGADYLLDTTLYAEGDGFDPGTSGIKVAWREFPGDEIHVLRHVES